MQHQKMSMKIIKSAENLKSSIKKIYNILEQQEPKIEIIDLSQSGHTAKMAADALLVTTNRICKSLIIKCDDNFFLCLVNGDSKLDFKKIQAITKAKQTGMATADEVKEVTGISIGGVSPVGLKDDLNCIIDDTLSSFSSIFCAAGTAELVFEIEPSRLQNLTNGKFEDIIKS